jgi:ribonuclease R
MKENVLEKRKEVIYDFICSESYVAMKIKEIAIVLQIPKENRGELRQILNELTLEGKIEVSNRGKYTKTDGALLVGKFIGHARGFGFVELEGEMEDIFISESSVNGALQGDTVQVVIASKQKGKRIEGKITKVLAHSITEIVGTFQRSPNFGFVITDNLKFTKDIFIPLERSKGAVTGHKVLVEITDYGKENKNPEGKVKEIIGHINDPGTDIMSIIYAYDLPTEFPEKVLNQIEKIKDEVSSADIAGRMDLRNTRMVTIDGEDAKDLDDAISLEKKENGYRLGVHIADVTNYVQEKSALDREALKRGTSVYLVDRVIPMLPHKLSNGICSLNQGVDRLALSCIMDIDFKGNVIGHKIAETVICVEQRMSYTSVKKILEDKEIQEIEKYQELVPMFQDMEELAQLLREKRRKRGSIDFDFPESKIILDKEGCPTEIKAYDRNVATKIIEDFMLLANETVAEEYFWQEIPFVYRTHETPDSEKIQKLALLISNFGYGIKTTQDEIHPKELQKLLVKIADTEEEALISRLTLRSMKQARYSPICTGHFGLAAPYYSHFTSPIRRYPDLQIHRIIKENLRGKLSEKRLEHYKQILDEVSKQSSVTERRAEEAERETIKLKKVEYMEKYIGESFQGVISSVTSWGMYVELPNTVEGMVHMNNMHDDFYTYNEEKYQLIGEKTHKEYNLGQKIMVKVHAVDKIQKTIDFIVDNEIKEE